MTSPHYLAEHIRLAMVDAGIDVETPTVENEGAAYVIRYPSGTESRWAADHMTIWVAEDALRRAYEFALILAHQQEEPR